MSELKIYNSLSKQKEVFTPINDGFVGMYVCGPTVYNNVHLGNCRTFTSFDVIYRFLLHLGYKIRYVRNITDVGHLTGDTDEGEDKMLARARVERLDPMEVAQKYTVGFHEMMRIFNTLPPSIEPRATGHILEQIEMVQEIIKNGYGYERNGSVYFDTVKFSQQTGLYGKLSGRVIEELQVETRDNLKNQDEKNHPSDFAIWMKASAEHLMKWNSPWSVGFPGWHLECSAMSTKYLGKTFDIHGGGGDLKFPHHENEVAQNHGACGCQPANYWLHTNMLLMNGKKMSKSDGNSITPEELFAGNSPHVSKAYTPMVLRFFMLQSHYSSTLDLTDEALLAAEKGYRRLMEGGKVLKSLETKASIGGDLDKEINTLLDTAFADMCDDFNTPKSVASLFELVTKINSLKAGHLNINELSVATLERLKKEFFVFIHDIFGLLDETMSGGDGSTVNNLMDLIIDIRTSARSNKDWATSDKIRDGLAVAKVQLKDGKEGTTWEKM
jgi:cysteinyl-tRNA synthetase